MYLAVARVEVEREQVSTVLSLTDVDLLFGWQNGVGQLNSMFISKTSQFSSVTER